MFLYRTFMRALTPVLAFHAAVHRLRGRMGSGGFSERFGVAPGVQGALWFHGASNGELTSARRVIEGLRVARPDLPIVVTSNSWTGRAMVRAWALPGVSACLAPFDTPEAVSAFCARWQPRALIFVENELWPERLCQMAARGPVICIGARMSEGSARNWRRLAPRLIHAMLGRVTLLSAQDAGSEARFLALGLAKDCLGPRLMLKAAGTASSALLPFAPPFPRARILLAASTHEGEEAAILQAFAQARAQFDLLILAPRHPRRSAEVAAVTRAAGLSLAIRSAGEVPGAETAVYLADTLGEMAGWYAMAGATVIGGTFGSAGGHTPYEPAAFGSAILHGPGVANFTEVFAALAAGRAALPVSPETLGAELSGLTAERQVDLAARATRLLTPVDDAALMAAVLALLPQPKG